MPGNHLVDGLIIRYLIFLLQDCKALVLTVEGLGWVVARLRGEQRCPSIGDELMSWRSQAGCGGGSHASARGTHIHTRTRTLCGVRPLLASLSKKPRIEWAWRLNYPSHL